MMANTLKIFVLATTYPESPKSTKPKFVHILNREMAKLGCSVTTIVPHSQGISTRQIINSVNVHYFRYLPEKYELNTLSIPDEIKRSKFGIMKISILVAAFFFHTFFLSIKSKPDIFQGHWAFPGGVLAVMLSKLFGKKSIVTSHYAEIPMIKKFGIIKKITAYWLNRSSKVIAVSNFTKQELVGIGVREEKISIIKSAPNFVQHTNDKELLSAFRNKLAGPDEKIVLFFGRLVENKGVEYLIRAFPKITTPNVKLVIVGGGVLKKKLEELTKNMSLEDKVIFYGRASDEDLGMLHDVSDIFACPSTVDSQGITEGLGVVIPEAMESGLPVIATSVGGIIDIVKHEINGILVEQKDPPAIAFAIDRIFSDQNLRNTLIKNGKLTAKEFSHTLLANQYLDLFKSFNI